MDTVGTLTSIALQYGVPLESLVKKFAYQRLSRAASRKPPIFAMPPALQITCFAGWRANSSKATGGDRAEPSAAGLPLKEIVEIEKKALNRPVRDLQRTGEKEVMRT